MSNHSVLEQNIIHQFGDCEKSISAFCARLPHDGQIDAERFALEVGLIVDVTDYAAPIAAGLLPVSVTHEVVGDLQDFILTRHRNWRHPRCAA